MLIHHALPSAEITSGITMVDTSVLPWPGYTFGHTSETDPDVVARSYLELARQLDVDRQAIVTATQVHGCSVIVVADSRPDSDASADALVTNRPQWILGVKLADCCGVLMWDKRNGAVAAVHSGWRGTAQNIVAATIATLHREYGTNPSDLDVCLSPCASGARYEVREDVEQLLPSFCTPVAGGDRRWMFDNHAAIRYQLLSSGVRGESINTDTACTIGDTRWHSHRRDGQHAGRMLAFIGLRPMAGK